MSTLEVPKPLPAELFFLLIHFLFILAPSLYESFSAHVFPWIPVSILIALPLSFAIDTLICGKKAFTEGFRPKANPGLWLLLLLPTILYGISKSDSPDPLKMISLYALPSLVTSAVSVASLVVSSDSVFHHLLFHGVLCEAYVGFLFLFSPTGFLQRLYGDLWVLVVYVILVHFSQNTLFDAARIHLPSTFTVGELALVSQGLTFTFLFLTAIFYCGAPTLYALHPADIISVSIAAAAFIFLGCIAVFPSLRDPSIFYGWFLSCILFGCVAILPARPVFWLFYEDPLRLSLLHFCVLVAGVTFCLIVLSRSFKTRFSVVVFRKFFHLLVNLVFVPCLLLGHASLARLLSVCVLVAFVVVEFVKYFRVPPLAGWLERCYEGLKDSKDVGKIMMSQIYLMVGFLLPLCFASCEGTEHLKELKTRSGYSVIPLCQWAGVVSLGIGDTFSAVVGSKFGRFNWKETRKTVEGTLAAILAQIAFVGAVYWFVADAEIIWSIAIPLFLLFAVNSLLETFTYQVDNVILSLLLFPALMNINWLRSLLCEFMNG